MSTDQQVAPPAAQQPERFENPGLPEHRGRLADLDPRAAKRAERQVALIFTISALASIVAVIAYFVIPLDSTRGNVWLLNLILGVGLGVGMLGIGVGAIYWAKTLMSNVEYVEERHPQRSDAETRQVAADMMQHGVEDSGIGRRPLLKGAVAGAAALAPLPFLVPLVGNLGGDWNVGKFRHTLWGETPEEFSGQLPDGSLGRRLAIDPSDTPIKAADVTIGSVFHVIPHGLNEVEHFYEEKAKAVVLLVRLDPTILKEPADRQDWSYDGIVAYSKICTHVGCPVALYEQQTHHLLCPCHQSTFDITDQAKVVFGPAKRPLPQLPIAVDDEGYLVARSDFDEPVGPSYWERLK